MGFRSGGAAFKSQVPRLPEERADAPPCTAYDPQLPARGPGAASVFKSTTARLPDEKSDAPPCTAYDPALVTSTKGISTVACSAPSQ